MAYAKRGLRLEYLVAGVLQGQGYLVRRRVPLKYGPKVQDATDIDVLGIKFTSPFQPHLVICDCKEKQRSKPYERIFWTKGLSSFVNAREAYVALPKASWEITKFAKSGKVRILTSEILKDSYAQIYGKDGEAYGLADQLFYESFFKQKKVAYKGEKDLVSAMYHARALYLVNDPYVSLNVAIEHLKIIQDMLRITKDISDDLFDLWRFVASDLTVVIPILLLYIASDTISLSAVERKKHIIEHLTYGDMAPAKAKEILNLAQELAFEAVKALNPEASQQSLLPFQIGDIEPPSYAPDVAGLVERAIASPSLYYELPQSIDFLLFEQSMKNKNFSDEEYNCAFPGTLHDERLKIARNIFSFIKSAVGFDLNVFWPNEKDNLPKKSTS